MNPDVARENRELHTLRAQVAAVMELHGPDPEAARSGRLVCAGCATHVTFTPWPCATAKALGAEL